MKRAKMQALTHCFIKRTVSLNSKCVLKYCSWTPKPAKFRNELKKAKTQKRHIISLNSEACACIVKNGALNDLMKMVRVLFITQAQLSSDQNDALYSMTIFILFSFLIFSQLLWQNVFKALQCSIRILFNELHLPTNHKTIKTEHTQYKQTHYVELSEKIPSVLPSLELTFSPFRTSLPPLWVSAFTGKLCLTSHAL